MTCSLCNKTAWYQVGKTGFCGDHWDEAVASSKSLGSKKTGEGPKVWAKEEA